MPFSVGKADKNTDRSAEIIALIQKDNESVIFDRKIEHGRIESDTPTPMSKKVAHVKHAQSIKRH